MLAWAPPEEKFVEIPGLIEICYKSDDPLFDRAPVDLYEEQLKGEGLSENHGKKDKQTSVQSYFKCMPCECDVFSVITLRAHCKGSQHIIKALRAKKEYNKSKNESSTSNRPPSRGAQDNAGPRDLYAALQDVRSAIVGLKFITEYTDPSEPNRRPFYHCGLPGCKDVQGPASEMAQHIVQLKHMGAWVQELGVQELGPAPRANQVIHFAGENAENLRDDYRRIKPVSDRDKYKLCSQKRIRGPGFQSFVKKERPKEYDRKRSPDGYPEFNTQERRHSPTSHRRREQQRVRHDGRDSDRSDRSRRDDDRTYDRPIKRSRSSERRRNSPPRSRSPRGSSPRSRPANRSPRSPSPRGSQDSQDYASPSPPPRRLKRERSTTPEPEVEEVEVLKQKGSFNFRDVSALKPEGTDQTETDNIETLQFVPAPEVVVTEEEIIKDFDRRVLDLVKQRLNINYPGAAEFKVGEEKISMDEYKNLAREFHVSLKERLMESHLEYNRSYKNLALTPDYRMSIKDEISFLFDTKLQELRTRHR